MEDQKITTQWTGNRATIYATLGAPGHSSSERITCSFYATEPIAIDLLKTEFEIPTNVWECAAGAGHLSKRLIETGHNVLSTDLYYHGYDECFDGLDFLQMQWPRFIPNEDSCILTSPSYTILEDLIEHALNIVPTDDTPVILLLKTISLESKSRYDKVFSRGNLHAIYQFVERLQCAKDGDFENSNASAIAYAFYIFKRKECTAPTIHWLTRSKLEGYSNTKSGKSIEMDSRQLRLF